MKVMASVGGWTYSKQMHKHMLDAASRAKMIESCVRLLEKYDDIFDGLDIDLEYPCPPNTKKCGPEITPSANDAQHFKDLI